MATSVKVIVIVRGQVRGGDIGKVIVVGPMAVMLCGMVSW